MQKNPNQMSLNIDPGETLNRKRLIYQMLVQYQPQEGKEGHTLEDIMKILKLHVTRKQMQKDLSGLVRDGQASVRIIAARPRYFLGRIPYFAKRKFDVTATVLLALQKISATKKNPEGYTNREIHEFLLAEMKVSYTLSQVCRATSRSRQDPHIISKRTQGNHGQQVDLFLWVEEPKQIYPIMKHPTPGVSVAETKTPAITFSPIQERLRAIAEEVRAIVGKGFISRELPLTVREEAFAAVDALDELVGKLK
jgi:hypothetical protein